MCSTLLFYLNLQNKSQQDFRNRFRRFAIFDFVIAAFQFVDFYLFGLDDIIFIITGVLFIIDVILLFWLLTYDKPPKHCVYINVFTNCVSLISYILSRILLLSGVDGKIQFDTSIIIGLVFFVLFLPIKILKIRIIHKYEQFCIGNVSKGDLLIPIDENANSEDPEDDRL